MWQIQCVFFYCSIISESWKWVRLSVTGLHFYYWWTSALLPSPRSFRSVLFIFGCYCCETGKNALICDVKFFCFHYHENVTVGLRLHLCSLLLLYCLTWRRCSKSGVWVFMVTSDDQCINLSCFLLWWRHSTYCLFLIHVAQWMDLSSTGLIWPTFRWAYNS